MRIVAIIPARYASERLPAKPLLDICGKPMIQHVYENALQAEGLDDVFVATDDERIAQAVQSFGGKVCMTSPACASGSDRVYEVSQTIEADFYINIQGDEPLLSPESLSALTKTLRSDCSIQVATLACPIDADTAQKPHCVKIVCDSNSNALYFSRSCIPFVRDASDTTEYLGHIGVYAYKANVLTTFAKLPPSPLEKLEKLEQLRLLQANIPMRVVQTTSFGQGVDTPEDLEAVRQRMGHYGENTYKASVDVNQKIMEALRTVKLIITDVDGVLTDGTLYYGEQGETLKPFNVRDGLGIRLLQKAGVEVAVLSGRDSKALRSRLRDLHITNFTLGELEKEQACAKIMQKAGVDANQTIFIGDDLPDAIAFKACGLGVTVADGVGFVKEHADFILQSKGGAGAFRELADAILDAQGRHEILRPSHDIKL